MRRPHFVQAGVSASLRLTLSGSLLYTRFDIILIINKIPTSAGFVPCAFRLPEKAMQISAGLKNLECVVDWDTDYHRTGIYACVVSGNLEIWSVWAANVRLCLHIGIYAHEI